MAGWPKGCPLDAKTVIGLSSTGKDAETWNLAD